MKSGSSGQASLSYSSVWDLIICSSSYSFSLGLTFASQCFTLIVGFSNCAHTFINRLFIELSHNSVSCFLPETLLMLWSFTKFWQAFTASTFPPKVSLRSNPFSQKILREVLRDGLKIFEWYPPALFPITTTVPVETPGSQLLFMLE